MSNESFAYWLQGYFEISGAKKLTGDQVKTIRNHINLVKKCWEPRKEELAEENSGDGFSFDDGSHSFDNHTPSGDVILRC